MKIASKLLLMTVVASVSVFILAIAGLTGMKQIADGLDNLNTNSIPSIVSLDSIGRDFLRLRIRMLNHIMTDEVEREKSLEAEMDKFAGNVSKELDRYGAQLVADGKDKELLEADRAALKAYADLREKGLALSRDHKKAEAQKLFIENGDIPKKATEALTVHAQYNVDLATREGVAARALYQKMNWIMLCVAAIAAIATIVVGYTIRKNVVESLSGLRATLGKIESSLDFTQRASVARQDEVGETAESFNRLTEKLQGSLRQISHQTQQVSDAATRLRETATVVSDSSSSQSASASARWWQ